MRVDSVIRHALCHGGRSVPNAACLLAKLAARTPLSHQAASGSPPVPRLRIAVSCRRHSDAEARWDGLLAARPCPWGSPSGDAERPSEAVDPQQVYVPCRCTGAGWCVDSGQAHRTTRRGSASLHFLPSLKNEPFSGKFRPASSEPCALPPISSAGTY